MHHTENMNSKGCFVMKLTDRGLCLYHRDDGSWYESDGNITFETEPAHPKTCDVVHEKETKEISKYM